MSGMCLDVPSIVERKGGYITTCRFKPHRIWVDPNHGLLSRFRFFYDKSLINRKSLFEIPNEPPRYLEKELEKVIEEEP